MCLLKIKYKLKANKLAKKKSKNCRKTKFVGYFKEYMVYVAYNSKYENAYIGLPQYILVNSKEVRWANYDEVEKIIDEQNM